MVTADPEVIRELDLLVARIHDLERERDEVIEQLSVMQSRNRQLQEENEELHNWQRRFAGRYDSTGA